jgi:hypothetical protein
LPIDPMKMALIRRRMSAKSSPPDWAASVALVIVSSRHYGTLTLARKDNCLCACPPVAKTFHIYVRFAANNDRESEFPQKAMSALAPESGRVPRN